MFIFDLLAGLVRVLAWLAFGWLEWTCWSRLAAWCERSEHKHAQFHLAGSAE